LKILELKTPLTDFLSLCKLSLAEWQIPTAYNLLQLSLNVWSNLCTEK
jgi:hypothetical protein